MSRMKNAGLVFLTVASALLSAVVFAESVGAGEIPLPELRALERAIENGMNSNLGSQTVGDLQRLKERLHAARAGGGDGQVAVLEPLLATELDDIRLLEREAEEGKRSALRTLSLYRLYQNKPEEALLLWRRMGETNANDLAYQLMASYLQLSLGEYEKARVHLETAERLIGTRSGLGLSVPVLCDNVAGYRLYAPRAKKDLLPGDNTLLYVEVEGADFQAIAGGESECRLMFGLRLKNDAGVTVWAEPNYGEYAPIFNGPVRDLHSALTWRVPNDLTPGVYTLIVEAVEETSKRRGDVAMEFTVAKRATNPQSKLDDGMRREVNKALQDAGKMFPGATQQFFNTEESGPGGFRNSDRYFDLLRQNERLNRGTE